MSLDLTLVIKRAVLSVLGIAGLAPFGLLCAEVVRRPDGEGITMALIFAGGATVAPFLLSTWDRWPRLKPGNRIGGFFLAAYLSPFVLLALAGAEHVEGSGFLAAPLAIGVTALWWSWRGYKLDQDLS